MAYDLSFNSPSNLQPDQDPDWPAEFIYDSPQPTPQADPPAAESTINPTEDASASQQRAPESSHNTRRVVPEAVGKRQPPLVSSPSSASDDLSSRESSENHLHHASSTTSSPPFAAFSMAANPDSPLGEYKGESMFLDMDDSQYPFDDSTFPMGEQGMNDLSLNALDRQSRAQTMDFSPGPESSTISTTLFQDPVLPGAGSNSTSMNPSPVSRSKVLDSLVAHAPHQRMTVQPSKMFQVGSREDSPASAALGNSLEDSPGPLYQNSPLSGSDSFIKAPQANYSNVGMTLERSGIAYQDIQQSSTPTSASPATQKKHSGSPKWPCRMTVDQTPDKSRVETQIPIKLTLHDFPPGITRIHLPSHTISKPKFQAKPPHQRSDDTLELSTMLVCASAMQKEGLEDKAFERALSDEIPIKLDESMAVSTANDDTDTDRPLNGGPVAICPGCIVRERKRAARKKTKKVEEEEEWAKDEAKRVIVFNCPEVRDWCVPGTKETPIKEHEGKLDHIFVQAPMRIACYCRHQSEKTGFQVIFTLKTASGKVLAQAMSNSIMITDDHKQPIQHPQSAAQAVTYSAASQIPAGGMFAQGYMVPQDSAHIPTFQETMPFRTSYSTNDLASMGRFQTHIMHQLQQQPSISRPFPNGRSQTSTASATPRNLSRPASPTDPTGQPSKKRRSGGIGKVPSGLTMTRLDTKDSPSGGKSMAGPAPTGPFSFQSPTASQFAPTLEGVGQPGINNNPYQSGPSTPHGGSISGYGSPAPVENTDPFGYYSAPTSQHPSRAPSPSSLRTITNQGFTQVPQSAADRLSKITSTLPAGLNLSRPPIIQRLIPPSGSRAGGDEVTILGSGFFQGLEVMFGDTPAANTVFWGDTTLVCRTPPSAGSGPVAVVFQHQHHTADPDIQQAVQQFHNILMPTRLVSYHYNDSDLYSAFTQQQQSKHGGIDPSQINTDALQARFLQQQNQQAQGLDNYIRSGPQPPRGAVPQGMGQQNRR